MLNSSTGLFKTGVRDSNLENLVAESSVGASFKFVLKDGPVQFLSLPSRNDEGSGN